MWKMVRALAGEAGRRNWATLCMQARIKVCVGLGISFCEKEKKQQNEQKQTR